MNYLINYIMDRHFPQFDNSRKTIVLCLDVGDGNFVNRTNTFMYDPEEQVGDFIYKLGFVVWFVTFTKNVRHDLNTLELWSFSNIFKYTIQLVCLLIG